MSRDFNAEIQELQEEIKAINQNLEYQKLTFMKEAISFAKDFMTLKAREIAQDEPEISKKLSEDGKMGQLKKEVSELIEDIEHTVQAVLSDEQLWWHTNRKLGRRGPDIYHFSDIVDKPPTEQDTALRSIVGRLVSVFERHGYLAGKHQVSSGVWRHPYRNDGTPYYQSKWQWSEAIAKPIFEYETLTKTLVNKEQKLKELEKSKVASEIGDLWDNA